MYILVNNLWISLGKAYRVDSFPHLMLFKLVDQLHWLQYDYIWELQKKAIVCLSGCSKKQESCSKDRAHGQRKVW